MLIAIPLIPLVKESWHFFRPRLQFEGWCAAVTCETGAGGAGRAAGAGEAAGSREDSPPAV
jgi:hypothetical protein